MRRLPSVDVNRGSRLNRGSHPKGKRAFDALETWFSGRDTLRNPEPQFPGELNQGFLFEDLVRGLVETIAGGEPHPNPLGCKLLRDVDVKTKS